MIPREYSLEKDVCVEWWYEKRINDIDETKITQWAWNHPLNKSNVLITDYFKSISFVNLSKEHPLYISSLSTEYVYFVVFLKVINKSLTFILE